MQIVKYQLLGNYSEGKTSKTPIKVRGVKPLEFIKQDESSQGGVLKIKTYDALLINQIAMVVKSIEN